MFENIFKKLWTGKLLPHTTHILAFLPGKMELEKVVEIADKIHDSN